jgi:poly(A) polymerase
VLAAGEDLAGYSYVLEKRQEWSADAIWPEPLVTGDDLIAMGLSPGPKFKEILNCVEDEQLEGRLASREQAIDFLKRRFELQ